MSDVAQRAPRLSKSQKGWESRVPEVPTWVGHLSTTTYMLIWFVRCDLDQFGWFLGPRNTQKPTQKDIEAEGLASISFRAPPMAANTRPPHAIDPDMGKQSTAQINMQLKLTFGGPK